jgi:hypothetical protein
MAKALAALKSAVPVRFFPLSIPILDFCFVNTRWNCLKLNLF